MRITASDAAVLREALAALCCEVSTLRCAEIGVCDGRAAGSCPTCTVYRLVSAQMADDADEAPHDA